MKVSSNLLPTYVRQRSIALHLGRRWLIAWGIIALLTVFWPVSWRRQLDPAAGNEKNYQQLTQTNQAVSDHLNLLQASNRRQEKTASLLMGLATTRVPPLILQEMARITGACNGNVRIANISVQQVPLPEKDGETRTRFLVDVEGLARSDDAVEQFVSQFSNSTIFQRADVKSIAITTSEEQVERRLSVSALVELDHAVNVNPTAARPHGEGS